MLGMMIDNCGIFYYQTQEGKEEDTLDIFCTIEFDYSDEIFFCRMFCVRNSYSTKFVLKEIP